MNWIENSLNHYILFLLSFAIVSRSDNPSKCQTDYDKEAQEAKFVEMTNSSIYKQWMRPEITTFVNVSIEMYSMASVDEKDSEYNIQILIDLEWMDSRLKLNNTGCDHEEDLTIEGSEWHLERIWSPKLRVPDNKNPSALDRDAKIILLRVSDNGYVRVRKRLNLDLFCKMNFRNYPLDKQRCRVSFVSSDLSLDYLVLDWTETDPFIPNSFFMNGFSLVGYELSENESKYSRSEKFSVVSVIFHLKREWGHYFLDIYLPSILIVVVSWISFWMEISVPPARVTLGVTTMLTLVTVAKDARENLPVVSYVNALDIWFVVCTGFIFMSLVEYAVISYISRAEKRKLREKKILRRNFSTLSMSSTDTQFTFAVEGSNTLSPPKNSSHASNYDGIEFLTPKRPDMTSKLTPTHPTSTKIIITPPESPDYQTESNIINNPFKMTPQEIAESIDRKCRIIFPVLFILFNLFYWILLCSDGNLSGD